MNNNTIVRCKVDNGKHNKLHNCSLETLNINLTCNDYNCEQKKRNNL